VRIVAVESNMNEKPKLWKSPGAWLKSISMVSAVWGVVYFFTGNAAAATTIAVIFVLMGFAGAFYT
jgi:hypothetical protein